MSSSRRDHLVDVALKLFYEHGYHATGIDQVIDVAGVAKMTLYKHFRSKEELLLAALQRRDETFRNSLMHRTDAAKGSVRDKLLVTFDVLGDFIQDTSFHGCMFINVSAEFASHDHPIHAAAAEHKRIMTAYLATIAAEGGISQADELACQLMILFDGAIVTAQVSGVHEAARSARRIAEGLVDGAIAA